MRGFLRGIMMVSFFAAVVAFVAGVVFQLGGIRLWAGGKGVMAFAAVCLLFTISSYLLHKFEEGKKAQGH